MREREFASFPLELAQVSTKGRTMEGYIYVDHPALHDRAVQACIRLALPHVLSLPAKAPPAKREGTKAKRK